MPLALDPDARAPYVLRSDRNKPAETRPTFYLRFLSVKQRQRHNERIEALEAAKGAKSINTILNESLGTVVVGWKNLPVDAPVLSDNASLQERTSLITDALDEMLIPNEKAEIAFAVPSLTDDDAKN